MTTRADDGVRFVVDILLSKVELADKLGTSVFLLDQEIRRHGDRFPVRRAGGPGVPYQYSLQDVREFLRRAEEEARREEDAREEALAQLALELPDGGESAKEQLARLKVEELRRRLARDSGLLVDTATRATQWLEVFGALGRWLDGMPDRLGRRYNLPPAVVESIREEVADERRAVVEKLKGMIGGGQSASDTDLLSGVDGGRRRYG